MLNIKLSILDLCYLTENDKSAGDVLHNSTKTAQLAEKLGYTRYWFAEHHNTGSLMSMFPEIMMAHVASKTERIRVGSGGVMLPNHSSLDRKSTRLNSSHVRISYAVFCLNKR